jgi:peptidoglycan/xylan/chitin deacetylase (PgdA/CDA1 family)
MNSMLRRATMALATSVCRVPRAVSAGAISAAWRGRAIVLLYHRISRRPSQVVPVVAPELFAEQLQALTAIADVVPADAIVEANDNGQQPRSTRLRVAITFDDDDPAHVESALPVLARYRAPATFFLSARSLHQLPHYWWIVLERLLEAEGLEGVCRRIGVTGTVSELASACRDPAVARRLADAVDVSDVPTMTSGDIRALRNAGMAIGFHTLRHLLLPTLDQATLEAALIEGRDALASAAGAPVKSIAYPHGYADARVARAAQQAGFSCGFVTGGRAVIASDTDRFRMPRWEPGPLPAGSLIAEALARLHGTRRSSRRRG